MSLKPRVPGKTSVGTYCRLYTASSSAVGTLDTVGSMEYDGCVTEPLAVQVDRRACTYMGHGAFGSPSK